MMRRSNVSPASGPTRARARAAGPRRPRPRATRRAAVERRRRRRGTAEPPLRVVLPLSVAALTSLAAVVFTAFVSWPAALVLLACLATAFAVSVRGGVGGGRTGGTRHRSAAGRRRRRGARSADEPRRADRLRCGGRQRAAEYGTPTGRSGARWCGGGLRRASPRARSRSSPGSPRWGRSRSPRPASRPEPSPARTRGRRAPADGGVRGLRPRAAGPRVVASGGAPRPSGSPTPSRPRSPRDSPATNPPRRAPLPPSETASSCATSRRTGPHGRTRASTTPVASTMSRCGSRPGSACSSRVRAVPGRPRSPTSW